MSPSEPERPWQPRTRGDPRPLNPFEHTTQPEASLDEQRRLEEIDQLDDPLEDPQDPPDPSEASDPETVANSNAGR
jgi:hypothetical protein